MTLYYSDIPLINSINHGSTSGLALLSVFAAGALFRFAGIQLATEVYPQQRLTLSLARSTSSCVYTKHMLITSFEYGASFIRQTRLFKLLFVCRFFSSQFFLPRTMTIASSKCQTMTHHCQQ